MILQLFLPRWVSAARWCLNLPSMGRYFALAHPRTSQCAASRRVVAIASQKPRERDRPGGGLGGHPAVAWMGGVVDTLR